MHKNFRKYNLLPKFLFAFACLIAISFSFASPTKAGYSCTGGGDHGGADWDPYIDCSGVIAGVQTNIGKLIIDPGKTVTVLAYNGTTYGSVNITASSVDIEGTLTANGSGYSGGGNVTTGSGPGAGSGANANAGGAGYGANGGSANTPGGSAYGSATAPVDLGSGGGGGNSSVPGGNGGGAIKITASGTVTINGTISANGGNGWSGSVSNGDSGGGSGGSIYITSGTLTGSGILQANGGGGGTGAGPGGNGSGGRIHASYDSSTFSGGITVNPGTTGNAGEPGTALLLDSTNNDLYIPTNNTWNASPSLEGSSFTYHSITLSSGVTWKMKGYYTTNTNGIGQAFTVTNFTVPSTSTITLDSTGYSGGGNVTTGSGPGAGSGANANAGGAGYGANGGSGTSSAAGGSAYGSATAPVDLGSGGGGGNSSVPGGNGGGAIKITASGTVTINGTISANGGNGWSGSVSNGDSGGGSGGSIYITSGTLTGSGILQANGGGAGTGAGPGGNGSGGRISIIYNIQNSYSGNIDVDSGGTGNLGNIGTINVMSQGNPTILSAAQNDTSCSSVISSGATITGSNAICVKVNGTDSLIFTTLFAQIEVEQNTTPFTDIPNATGSTIPYSGGNQSITVISTSLNLNTSYHWQVRIVDGDGYASSWYSPGGNPDFVTQPNLLTRVGTAQVDTNSDFNNGTSSSTSISGSGTSAGVNLTTTASGISSMKYFKPIYINNPAGILTNYQISLQVNTSSLISTGKMLSTCADIRFTDSDQTTLLNFWMESGCNTTTTQFWVKVPSISATTRKTIYMYYDNPVVLSASNGSSTFDFFDDFSTLNPSTWTATGSVSQSGSNLNISTGSVYSNNLIASEPNEMVEAKFDWTNTSSGLSGLTISSTQSIASGNGSPGSMLALYLMNGSSSTIAGWANNTASTGFNEANGVTQFNETNGTSYTLGFLVGQSSISFYKDRSMTEAYNGSWSHPFYVNLGSYLGSGAGTTAIAPISADWIIVRQQVPQPPTFTTGSEEQTFVSNTGNWQSSTNNSLLTLIQNSAWGDGTSNSIAFSANLSNLSLNDSINFSLRTASTASGITSASYIPIGTAYGGSIYTATSSSLNSLGIKPLEYAQIKATFAGNDGTYVPFLDNVYLYFTPKVPISPASNITVDTDTDFNKGSFSDTSASGSGTNATIIKDASPGETYYKPITIDNSGNTNTLSNYQISYTIDTASLISAGKLRSDCGDIRMYDSDQTTAINNFWIENCNNSATIVWVKVPTIPALSTKVIYLFYGNSNLTSLSSASNTFISTISNLQLSYRFDEISGNAIDYSGNGYTGIATGTTAVSGKFNNGRSFNGTSDYTTTTNTTNINSATDFSIDFWVNPGTSQNAYANIFDKRLSGQTNGFALEQNNSTLNQYYFSWGTGSSWVCNTVYITLTASTWQHVAIVYSSANGKVQYYLNGVAGNSCTGGAIQTNAANFTIGQSPANSGRFWKGIIDEFHFYNKALSSTDIANLSGNYGYTTINSANTANVRQYSSPEPSTTVGSETPIISTGTWTSDPNSNVLTLSNIKKWGDGTDSSIAFWANDSNLDSNNSIDYQIRTSTTSGGLLSATYYDLGTVSEGISLIKTKADFASIGINTNQYVQMKITFYGYSIVNTATLDRFIIYYQSVEKPNIPTNLSQYKNDATTSILNGSWTPDGITNNIVLSFLMSSPNASDTLTPEVEVEPSSSSFTGIANFTGTAVTYNGSDVTGTVALTGLSNCGSYKWQAFVNNSIGQSNPVVFNLSTPNFSLSNTAPTAGSIYDGNTNGVENTNTTDIRTINANWTGFSDACSGLQSKPYQIAVGTTSGGTNILGYTQTGIMLNNPFNTFSNNVLNLMTGKTYYVSIKATNNAGLSTTITSTGQSVIPFLSFSIDSPNVNLGEWNASNSFLTFASNTLSVFSNAYNGYNVYGSMPSPLTNTNTPTATIPAFSGGTYLNPSTWNTGQYGFGYTTSSTINGLDPFTASTKFAPFSLNNPGDIVAQNLTNVTGANYTGTADSYTIKYKTAVSPKQASGTYASSIDYTLIPSF